MLYDLVASGKRIQQMRMQLGLTQEEFSEKLGVGREAIGKIEAGMKGASIDLLIIMSEMFNCTIDDIVLGRKRKSNYENAYIELMDSVLAVLRKNNVI